MITGYFINNNQKRKRPFRIKQVTKCWILNEIDLVVNFEISRFCVLLGKDFAAWSRYRKRYIIQQHHITIEEFRSETRERYFLFSLPAV